MSNVLLINAKSCSKCSISSYFITKISIKNGYLNHSWNLYTLQLWFNFIFRMSHKNPSITFSSTKNIINIGFVFKLQLDHQGFKVKVFTFKIHIVKDTTTNYPVRYKKDVQVDFQQQFFKTFFQDPKWIFNHIPTLN